MSKKAQITGETIIWVYRFVIIGLISLSLVIIIGNKYAEKYDIRPAESIILTEKIIDCIKNSSDIDMNFMSSCLNLPNIKDYYINITMIPDSNYNKSVIIGNSDLKVMCNILNSGKTKSAKSPACSYSDYFIFFDNQKFSVKLETDIGKYEKNLK